LDFAIDLIGAEDRPESVERLSKRNHRAPPSPLMERTRPMTPASRCQYAALKARGREIFYDKGTPEEKEAEAREDALYALRAFRTAWQHSELT
jgi:hypothetical protein